MKINANYKLQENRSRICARPEEPTRWASRRIRAHEWFETLLRSSSPRALCVFTILIAVPSLNALDFPPQGTKNKPALEKEAIPKRSAWRASKKRKTPQEREEESMLQTIEELVPIAQALAKFAGSKEIEEVVKRKKQLREQKEKESEVKRKQAASASQSRRSSGGGGYGGGGYSPRGGGYGGGGGYYSPAGSSRSSPWGSSKGSTPWSNTPSGNFPSRQDHSFDFDDDDFDTTQASQKAPDKKKKKQYGPGIVSEGLKDAEINYTRATNSAKAAADELKIALDKANQEAQKSGDPIDAAKSLLSSNIFSKLTSNIETIEKAEKDLNVAQKKELDQTKGNQLSKEKKRLEDLCKSLSSHALLAATLESSDLPFKAQEQEPARKLLEESKMGMSISDAAIDKRATGLLTKWAGSPACALFNQNVTNIATLKTSGPPTSGETTKTGLNSYFTARRKEIAELMQKFPKHPGGLKKKLAEIDKHLADVDKLT